MRISLAYVKVKVSDDNYRSFSVVIIIADKCERYRSEINSKVLVVVSEAQDGSGLRLVKDVLYYFTVICPFISRGRSQSRSAMSCWFSLVNNSIFVNANSVLFA